MNRIRTILIEDSVFMRRMISDIIKNDESIDLVGVAKNGKEGTDLALTLKPDVVITDMIMPDFDGVFVVNELMKKHPLPIILLSSLDKTDSRIFDALENGAFEFIDKPSNVENGEAHRRALIELIKQAYRTDISLLKARQLAKHNSNAHRFDNVSSFEIIVIGASTGGPGAVEHIIMNLPSNLHIPVVVVQHMPSRFLETFSQRLNEHSPLTVRLARNGENLKGGVVYVAPGENNIRIERNHLTETPMFTFTNKQYTEFNFPSVDCLFESVATTYGKRSIAVILTGMGKDGMDGLKKIKEQGGFTIAQDEASSVVFGMPKAAIEHGAVKQILNLRQIPGFIVSCI